MGAIRRVASLIEPKVQVTAALDPDDNIFLECAESADAHFLVTGNSRHFPSTWVGTRIVTPRQLVETIAASEAEPA